MPSPTRPPPLPDFLQSRPSSQSLSTSPCPRVTDDHPTPPSMTTFPRPMKMTATWRGCWAPRPRKFLHIPSTETMTLLSSLCRHLLCTSLLHLLLLPPRCALSPVCLRSQNTKEKTAGWRTPSSPLLQLVLLTDSVPTSVALPAVQTHTEPPRPVTLSRSLGAPGTILLFQHHCCTPGLPQATQSPQDSQQ